MTTGAPSPMAVPAWRSPWAYVNVLLRRRRLLVTSSAAIGLVTGVITFVQPREYVASASFVPQEPVTVQSGLGQLASQFGLAGPQAATNSPLFYADLLQSREVLRAVLTSQYQVGGPHPFRGSLLKYLEIEPDTGDAAVQDGMRELQKNIGVRTDRTTGVVRFSLHTRMPDLSAQVARRFLELVNDYNLRRRQSQAKAEREFIEQRLAVAKDALTEAEDALAAFYRSNRSYRDSPQLVAEEQRLQRQVVQRQTLYITLGQSFESAKIEEVRNTPVITLVERPEGFVEPQPRGTIRKTLVGAFVGFFVVALLLYLQDVLKNPTRTTPDYEEFLGLFGEMTVGVRARFSRRPGPSSPS